MSVRTFFDSNVLIYAFNRAEPQKSTVAQKLILSAVTNKTGVISYQILQEVLNVGFKKFRVPFTPDLAREYLHELAEGMEVIPWSPALMDTAISLRLRYRRSWYDSIVMGAAV